jgi:pimeloyl-ACP methyl ester carboxylesterase
MARFVFVHGAFGGAWCWEPIVGPLEAAGHTVETLDLPGLGDDPTPVEGVTLEACAARVCAQLRERPEPAVLVGHSMGGIIITQASSDCTERVAELIFVAAFMPGNGQSLLDLTGLPEGKADLIQANIVVEGNPPVATLSSEAAAEAIYNCCTSEQVRAAIAKHRPQPVAPFATPVSVSEDVLASIPRSYVFAARDQSIPPALQRRMIAERPCRKVIELDTDHAPQLSATSELVQALIDIVADASTESVAAPAVTGPDS